MLSREDIDRLKEIFITRDECQDNMESTARKFANDDKRLAVIENNTKLILGVLSAVGVGVLGIVLKMLF